MLNRTLKWTPTQTQLYFRDGTGNELASLEREGMGATVLKEANLYGSDRLGTYRPGTETAGGYRLNHRSYDLKDHLGNIRATVSDLRSQNGTDLLPTLSSASEYYPFGMESRKAGTAGRFGYNGKENDKTIGVQDYGFRLYKPELGRFLSQDPLRKDYPELTTYQFASNTPIQAIDLDGLEAAFFRALWRRVAKGYSTLISKVTGLQINIRTESTIGVQAGFVMKGDFGKGKIGGAEVNLNLASAEITSTNTTISKKDGIQTEENSIKKRLVVTQGFDTEVGIGVLNLGVGAEHKFTAGAAPGLAAETGCHNVETSYSATVASVYAPLNGTYQRTFSGPLKEPSTNKSFGFSLGASFIYGIKISVDVSKTPPSPSSVTPTAPASPEIPTSQDPSSNPSKNTNEAENEGQ